MRFRILAILAALAASACATGDPSVTEGAGYAGTLSIRPDPLRLEDTVVGCSRGITLLLANESADQPLTITDVTLPNPSLQLAARPPFTLAPGERRGLEIQFAPREAGEWSGSIDFLTSEEGGSVLALATRANALAPPERAPGEEIGSLDIVFVLDVSTTMDEMASLRGAIASLFDKIESQNLDVRFGLTTFVNDVVVHRDGAFLDRKAFFEEFDSQLVEGRWVPDPDNPRQQINFDFAENSLGALERSANEFDFRPEARRYLLLVTDATFDEPPSVFSDGTPARVTLAEVAETLEERRLRLFSVHSSAAGRGFSSAHNGQPPLVSASGGTWFEISEVSSGVLTLDALLADLLVAPACD